MLCILHSMWEQIVYFIKFLWHHSLSLPHKLYVKPRDVLLSFKKILIFIEKLTTEFINPSVLVGNKRNVVGQHCSTECLISI